MNGLSRNFLGRPRAVRLSGQRGPGSLPAAAAAPAARDLARAGTGPAEVEGAEPPVSPVVGSLRQRQPEEDFGPVNGAPRLVAERGRQRQKREREGPLSSVTGHAFKLRSAEP